MGALTISRKRSDDYFKTPSPISPAFDHSCAHISKKPKLTNFMNLSTLDFDRHVSAKSVISRISQYPDSKPRFMREVHAPVRTFRFGFSGSKNTTDAGASSTEKSAGMGNAAYGFLKSMYDNAWNSARRSFRYIGIQREKEVIELDDEIETRDVVSEDLSIQEVETVDFPGSKGREGNNVLKNPQKLKGKIVDNMFQSLDSSVVLNTSQANGKVDCSQNMDLIVLDPEESGVSTYKKLHNSAEKRNDKLDSIRVAIELEEKRLRNLHLIRPHKSVGEAKDLADECFVPLTQEEEAEVSWALSSSNRKRVLVSRSNIDITGEKLQCLKPGAWLNDEVINVYLELLKEREKREPEKFLTCHFFNTFFYKKLIRGSDGYTYDRSIARWTTQKKLGYSLLECDKIFVPIHKEVHWCLAIINKKDEKFQYLDSLRGIDAKVMKVLARYFVDEVRDKTGKDINVDSWEKEYVIDLPEQENGFDCGMFMIKYADFYSRDVGLCFNQEHMPYFRKRTAKEILRLKAE